jgi:hypothetical protein
MDGQEMLERRYRNQCMRCGVNDVEPDADTGFPKLHCRWCAETIARSPKPTSGTAKFNREHHEEGIKNLDALVCCG